MKKPIVRFTIAMPEDVRDIVRDLGTAETRNLSDQINVLVREALERRGVPLSDSGYPRFAIDLNSYLTYSKGQK